LYNNLGNVNNLLRDFVEALKYYQKSIDIRTELYGELHQSLAIPYSNICLIYNDLGNFQMAESTALKSIAIYESNQNQSQEKSRNDL